MIYFCENYNNSCYFYKLKSKYLINDQLKIVLVGGPGTGKTSVLNKLSNQFTCFDEISREIITEAQQKGIEQLFLKDPILFSKLLLEKREQQFLNAEKSNESIIFFDRGIPDVLAYLKYSKTKHPKIFNEKCLEYRYNLIFHFSPWEEIHKTDNERYESFDQTKKIDTYLKKTYSELNYSVIDVPFGSIDERTDYIINTIDIYK